jgi:hypothetical protein
MTVAIPGMLKVCVFLVIVVLVVFSAKAVFWSKDRKKRRPICEILVLVWPVGISALLTEIGYLLPQNVAALFAWYPIPIAIVVGIPLVLGVTLFYRYVDKANRYRGLLSAGYGVVILLAIPYVDLLVAAANGQYL